jgi:hypothetical protein
MPLSEPRAREHIHTRHIDCRGYKRDDGLWDIEGQMVDTKSYAFDNRYRGQVLPGTPVHDMWLRITVNDSLEIVHVEAATDASPYPPCPEITPDYRKMIGTRIRSGWTSLVRERLGGTGGCTHQTRLIQELAVVAIQTVVPKLMREGRFGSSDKPPPQLDSCYALRSNGPVVEELYPRWFRS